MGPSRRSRILIANRDQTFLDQLVERLLNMNVDVDFANEGKSTVELIEAEVYDLVVLDIALPIHNGLQILELVKHMRPETPVLILTFSSTQDLAEQALRQGAYGYLLRPLEDMKDFDRAVNEGLFKPGPDRENIENYYAQVMGSNGTKPEIRNPAVLKPKPKPAPPPTVAPQFGPSSPPLESLATKSEAFSKAREEHLTQVIDALPDGILELNSDGQIMSCNPPARDWLRMDARSAEKLLARLLRSIAKSSDSGKTQIQVGERLVGIWVKPLNNSSGELHRVVVIRDVTQPEGVIRQRQSPPSRPARRSGEEIVHFKNVGRMPISDTPEEGWSILLMVDKMKTAIKDEVQRFLEDNPIDWLEKVLEPEPEEIDPDTLLEVSQRLSRIR